MYFTFLLRIGKLFCLRYLIFRFSLCIASEEELYEVERVVDKKVKEGKVYYLIKWLGYGDEDNTWERYENCKGVQNLIDEFEERLSQQERCKSASKKRNKGRNNSVRGRPKERRKFKKASEGNVALESMDAVSIKQSVKLITKIMF